jgi:hypothetical protein
MDNPEKLATFGTQDTGRRQTKVRVNEEWTIKRNWQHLVHKTQDEDKSKLRGNHEWTIQRNWQHLVHKTEDEDKQN